MGDPDAAQDGLKLGEDEFMYEGRVYDRAEWRLGGEDGVEQIPSAEYEAYEASQHELGFGWTR